MLGPGAVGGATGAGTECDGETDKPASLRVPPPLSQASMMLVVSQLLSTRFRWELSRFARRRNQKLAAKAASAITDVATDTTTMLSPLDNALDLVES